MNDDDREYFMDLFDNWKSDIDKKMSEKCSYELIHLPLSIIEILTTWKTNCLSQRCNNCVDICPCDDSSLDGIFIHILSE
jgi:hypothetical protein